MKYIFAGDRKLSVEILDFMVKREYRPLGLIINSNNGSHSNELINISQLEKNNIFDQKVLSEQKNIDFFVDLEVDYIICIHFPFMISKTILDLPKIGVLNLHPSYLPYNKGWHTPTWTILNHTICGATFHFMSEKLDEGDIIHQKKMKVLDNDTADSLYKRILTLEFEVFCEAFDSIISLRPNRNKQKNNGSSHKKSDLFEINELDLSINVNIKNLLNKLRALTTNDIKEAAYFKKNGSKYAVLIDIKKINEK
jgi:dTDP-4-amino-4,6-dideoxyglucose formyltransferase